MDESKDHLERRCPRLGGPVSFRYCRKSGEDGWPCWKVFDCWWEYFDVRSFFKRILPAHVFNKLGTARPRPKISSLVELIAQAKKNVKKG